MLIGNLNTKQIRIHENAWENGKNELLKGTRLRGEK
jgi:hypothetical protein